MAIKHLNIRVHGNVQGVFFRAHTLEKAKRHQITGFVRNEPDGTVYIEAEGKNDELKKFIDWCKLGPPSARVESIDISDGEVQEYQDFEIAYR